MTKTKHKTTKVEKFVRSVLTKDFNQKIDPDTLRSVAEKVSRAVEVKQVKKNA